MRIELRVADGSKRKERFITGLYFAGEQDTSVILFPVPELANDAKCKECGQPAHFLVEGYEFFCGDCLTEKLGKTELKEQEISSSPSLSKSIYSSMFEWSPNDGKNWYRVKGKNLKCVSNLRISKEEIAARFHKKMEQVLIDKTQEFEAEYDKTEKELTIMVF